MRWPWQSAEVAALKIPNAFLPVVDDSDRIAVAIRDLHFHDFQSETYINGRPLTETHWKQLADMLVYVAQEPSNSYLYMRILDLAVDVTSTRYEAVARFDQVLNVAERVMECDLKTKAIATLLAGKASASVQFRPRPIISFAPRALQA